MDGHWRDFARGQVDGLADHLNAIVSSMERFVRTQFGVEAGSRSEWFRSWMVLLTLAGLTLLLSGFFFSGASRAKKRRNPVGTGESVRPTAGRAEQPEEERRKRRRKKAEEKRLLSNGRPATPGQFPVKVPVKVPVGVSRKPPQHRGAKAAAPKAAAVQVKKEKTKTKTDVKLVQHVSTNGGRTSDEGAWETKVSSRERRQQRRKDNDSETSVKPGGSVAKNNNKNPQSSAPASRGSESTDDGGWTDVPSKGQGRVRPTERTRCVSSGPMFQVPPEAREESDLRPASLPVPGAPVSMTTAVKLQCSGLGGEDNWSALNGVVSMDTGSDWKAPAEYWGNYEDPAAASLGGPAFIKEDEKDGAAKSRRRRTKKRTEASTQVLNADVRPAEPSVKDSSQPSQKKKKKKK